MAAHKAEKRYLTHLVVEGSGTFPIDMLRYDRCVPETERDASEIAASFSRHFMGEKMRVKLLRFGANPLPANGGCFNGVSANPRMEYGRWASFGWTVVEEFNA